MQYDTCKKGLRVYAYIDNLANLNIVKYEKEYDHQYKQFIPLKKNYNCYN